MLTRPEAEAALTRPATAPAILAEIAEHFPDLRQAVSNHPASYPALIAWIAAQAPQTPAAPLRSTAEPLGARPIARRRGGLRLVLFGGVAGVVVSALVVAVLVLTGIVGFGATGNGTSSTVSEGPGYDSPEDAAEAFVSALRDRDFRTMTETFAVESFVESCDHEAQIERLEAYTPYSTGTCPFPADDDLGAAANLAGRAAFVSGTVNQILARHVSPHLWNEGRPEPFSGDPSEAARRFEQQTAEDFDDYRFADSDGIKALDPEDLVEFYETDATARIHKQIAASYGLSADEYTDAAIEFEADGETWLFTPAVGQYDGRWYIVAPSGTLAALLGVDAQNSGLFMRNEID